MAFLGGLLSGMSTSTMGFITGAAEEAQRQLNPEPVEMTDAEKLQMKFRYDTLGKEYDKLTEVKDGMVGFGKKSDLVLTGPYGERLPYSEYEFNVSTISGKDIQEQAAKFNSYSQINDIRFANLPEEERNKLRLYATNHSQYFTKLLNEDNDGRKKDVTLTPEWDKIIPGAPDWLVNTLQTNLNNKDANFNKNMLKDIPQVVLEKVNKADLLIGEGFGGINKNVPQSQMDEAQGEVDLRNTKATLEYNILSHHMFKYGAIEKGDEENLVLRHVTMTENYPEFFTVNARLSRDYLTSEQHPAGQAFNTMPVLSDSNRRATYLEVMPSIYNSAVNNAQGRNPIEVYHKNAIDSYKAMYRNSDIVNEMFSDGTGQYTVRGKVTKKDVIEDLAIDMDVYVKRGDAWQQYKGVHSLFMKEMSGDTAVGGKAYETAALGIDMFQNIPKYLGNIVQKIKLDSTSSVVPGFLRKRLSDILEKNGDPLGKKLSPSELDWLSNNGYEGDYTELGSDAVKNAAETGQDGTTSRNQNLLASIARQRALALEMTYLAAAVVQGEGGKAISDGDQQQFLKALSYGWWSTVEQRVSAAQGIYESIALYGETALAYKNANTAEEIYGIREYEQVSDISDYNSQSGNLIPDRNDPELISSSEGEKVYKYISVRGLDLSQPNVGESVTVGNMASHKLRLIQMDKENEFQPGVRDRLLTMDPDIFTIKTTEE